MLMSLLFVKQLQVVCLNGRVWRTMFEHKQAVLLKWKKMYTKC
jgi:hypothetical protein